MQPQTRSILVGESQREALLTADGQSLRAEIVFPPHPVLRFSAAAVKSHGVPSQGIAEAVVSWRTGSEEHELYSFSVTSDAMWTEHTVEIADVPALGELRLTSRGAWSVAWSELYLYSEDGEPGDERPNLVLIVIDTLRADHMSSYGYGRPTTPRIDRLAGESLVFLNSYSASTWTLPSGASLLTGLFPGQHGLRSVDDRLSPDASTVARHLRAAGYRTVAFTDGGFFRPRWGFGLGFERYDSTPGEAWEEPKDVTKVVAAARDWLENAFYEPFFLLLHTYEVHQPYANTEDFAAPFLDAEGPRPHLVRPEPFSKKPLDPRELRHMRNLYDGEIRRADHYLGEILDLLTGPEMGQSTAILLTSDHGEEFMEHGGLEHGFGKVYDESVRVPLILRPPGSTQRQDVASAVSGVDVAPTLLALAGIETAGPLPGRSLLDVAASREERPVLVQGLNSFRELKEDRLRLDFRREALILDRVRRSWELYDLMSDPAMERPILKPDALAEASQRLEAIQAWLSIGHFAVRLPSNFAALSIPESSRILPTGVWQGNEWRGAPDEGPLELSPDLPSVLIFDLRPGRDLKVELWQNEGTMQEALLLGRHGPYQPMTLDLPPDFVIFQTAERLEAGERDPLNAEEIRELESLGYL